MRDQFVLVNTGDNPPYEDYRGEVWLGERLLTTWSYDKKQRKYICTVQVKGREGKKRLYQSSPKGFVSTLEKLISKNKLVLPKKTKEKSDFQFWKEEFKAKKEAARTYNQSFLESFALENDLRIEPRTSYHFSVYDSTNYRIDFFPTSGKYHDVERNVRGRVAIEDIADLFTTKTDQQ